MGRRVTSELSKVYKNKKAMLSQGNRPTPQVFFSV